MMDKQIIWATLVILLVVTLGLIWARKEAHKKLPNIRAFIWFRLGAWAFANGDAAVLRAQRAALYKVAANSRAGSEAPLDIWGGRTLTSRAGDEFEAWKRRAQEEEACPI